MKKSICGLLFLVIGFCMTGETFPAYKITGLQKDIIDDYTFFNIDKDDSIKSLDETELFTVYSARQSAYFMSTEKERFMYLFKGGLSFWKVSDTDIELDNKVLSKVMITYTSIHKISKSFFVYMCLDKNYMANHAFSGIIPVFDNMGNEYYLQIDALNDVFYAQKPKMDITNAIVRLENIFFIEHGTKDLYCFSIKDGSLEKLAEGSLFENPKVVYGAEGLQNKVVNKSDLRIPEIHSEVSADGYMSFVVDLIVHGPSGRLYFNSPYLVDFDPNGNPKNPVYRLYGNKKIEP